MMLKTFYLHGFVKWTKFTITICSLISFLTLQLNEFSQSEIKQNYLQFKKWTEIIFSSKNELQLLIRKKWVYSVCLGALHSPPQFSIQIRYLFCSAWFSFLLEFTTQEKKANQELYLNEAVLQRCNLPFLSLGTFEKKLKKLWILSKIWKWRI